MDRASDGFTVVELLVTIAILAILYSIAVPAFSGFLEKHRLTGAAETIAARLQWSRSEAIKKSRKVYVSLFAASETDWCVGFDDSAYCDCSNADDCQVDGTRKVSAGTEFASSASARPRLVGVTFSGDKTSFDPVRGTAGSGRIKMASAKGRYRLNIVVSSLGLVRLCSPAGTTHVPGYPTDC